MNLEAPPGAPLILHIGAGALLVTHIAGGAIGIASGFVSIFARKGGPLHRQSGTLFFGGMLAMATVGAGVAPFLPDAAWVNTTAAVFTLYILVTGWYAARRPTVGLPERLGAVVAALVALTGPFLLASGIGARQGDTVGAVYVFSGIAALAALSDWRLLRRGIMPPADRRTRHLWRMSAALAIAAGSYFVGQPKFVPPPIRGTFLAVLPMLTALAMMTWWWARTKLAGRRPLRPRAVAA
ncbi:hypothetical protein [Phenylobacterium sp.]|uniref:hypothetical protein n=1 Tax=Phenylobacterium sp. TaxID=1871053 RepID=UPI002F92A2F0